MTMDPLLLLAAAALLAVAVGLPLRRLGFVTRVESWSMAPTLAPGRLVLTRRPGRSRDFRRGDVVVVDSDELGRAVVKRVVGLAGEHVVVSRSGLQVDGRPVAEPYVVHQGGPSGSFDVPEGRLLLLGDNRARSDDSRSWRQPYLPVEAVRGTVLLSPRWRAATADGPAPRPARAARGG
jgi:signal peptidase I